MYCQMVSNCDYDSDTNISKNMSTVILWWMKSCVMLPTNIELCENERWCYNKWMLTNAYVIYSMFSNGPSSVRGKEKTCDARRRLYASTLADLKTMAGDIHLSLFYV